MWCFKKHKIKIDIMQFGEEMTNTKRTYAENLFKKHGPILKSGKLREHGIYHRDIVELVDKGDIIKLKTGSYIWAEIQTEITDMDLVIRLIPFGVVCLQSAASYHELTLLNPLAITIAIPANRTRTLLPDYPPVELVAYPIPSFELGVIVEETEDSIIRVYDRERTVCDFFRKRKQLGEDLALSVLKEYMKGERNLQKLFDYAGMLHIKGVMKSYVEALL